MTTATLTEFLLARIAEDEADLVYEFSAGAGTRVGGRDIDMRARVLAECEAKRRIVEDCRYWIDEDGHYGVAACEAILRRLAVVYSDHPDYRDEWRP